MSETTKYPETIEVIFTEHDLLTASVYCDNEDCLLATALKRMGYSGLNVYGSGQVCFPEEAEYIPDHRTPFDSGIALTQQSSNENGYNDNMIGYKVILIKINKE